MCVLVCVLVWGRVREYGWEGEEWGKGGVVLRVMVWSAALHMGLGRVGLWVWVRRTVQCGALGSVRVRCGKCVRAPRGVGIVCQVGNRPSVGWQGGTSVCVCVFRNLGRVCCGW